MGVGRDNKDIFFGPYVQENEMHILENQSGQSTDEEDVPPLSRAGLQPSSPRRRCRTRPRSSSLEACLTGMYRRCGARQARRVEHIKHLLSLRKEGEEGSEVVAPTYSTHTSPFAQLLQQRTKMQAWNDFINSSEEDQERILQMRTAAPSLSSIQEESGGEEDANGNRAQGRVSGIRRKPQVASASTREDEDNGNAEEGGVSGVSGDPLRGQTRHPATDTTQLDADLAALCLEGEGDTTLDDSWERVEAPSNDRRSVHPGYSSAQCFQRVDRKLRSLLTRRHLPQGLVAQLEREVVEFFTDCPGSVYVSRLSSSFERLLLHAVCQYLGLHCRRHQPFVQG